MSLFRRSPVKRTDSPPLVLRSLRSLTTLVYLLQDSNFVSFVFVLLLLAVFESFSTKTNNHSKTATVFFSHDCQSNSTFKADHAFAYSSSFDFLFIAKNKALCILASSFPRATSCLALLQYHAYSASALAIRLL